MGEFATAQKNFEEGIALSKEAGEKHEMAMASTGLGDLHLQQADFTGARQYYEAALNARKELGEKEATAESLLQIAVLSIEEGRPGEAESLSRKALEQFQAEKMTSQQVWACGVLARAALAQGKVGDAQKSIVLATPILPRSQQRDIQLELQIVAARVHAASGKSSNVESALHLLDSAMKAAQ